MLVVMLLHSEADCRSEVDCFGVGEREEVQCFEEMEQPHVEGWLHVEEGWLHVEGCFPLLLFDRLGDKGEGTASAPSVAALQRALSLTKHMAAAVGGAADEHNY